MTLISGILNKLSKNLSFGSEFVAFFQLSPIKVVFLLFFLNGIFQGISRENGLIKDIDFAQR